MAMVQAGTALNVIPDSVTIAGTFRAFSKKSFNALRDRIEEVTPSTVSFTGQMHCHTPLCD